jgi:hypothetical protein
MAQIRSNYEEVRIPFAKMSFSPDVPSTALGPNEYNAGLNVEADVRGIRSVAGDEELFNTLTGTPIFITAGFRADGNYWFVVSTEEGKWWATYDGTWADITPGGGDFSQYAQNTNITESWNGTVLFLNDTFNPPMVWLEGASTLTIYSNIQPADIANITFVNPTTLALTFNGCFTSTGSNITGTTLTIGTLATGSVSIGQYVSGAGIAPNTKIVGSILGTGSGSTWEVNNSQTTGSINITGSPYSTAPYGSGDKIVITGASPGVYNGEFTVVSSTVLGVSYTAAAGSAYVSDGVVSPKFSWNYNPNWSSVTANFMRLYNTPNVGSILVAGNLTAVDVLTSATETYPVTVQWSQNFGLNSAPLTWQPTVTNVANQLEVPLRGPALDAFPCNGQFFLCSYWDTVVFSPINYTTTSAPILGVRLFNQGRGLLSSNCWANTDKLVYGVDARDIWVFNGQDFQGIGNQRVKNWFYDQLDPQYYDRVYMQTNTQKNQIEIYYPDADATNGVPNKMLSYRYDLDCWNAPREVQDATFATESPIYTEPTPGTWQANFSSRTVVYARGVTDQKIVQKDIGYDFLGNPIASTFRRDNIKLLKDYSGKLMVHRILPEAVNIGAEPFTPTDEIEIIPSPGEIGIKIEGANSIGSLPASTVAVTMDLDTNNPWCQINQNAYRVNSIEITNTSDTDAWICPAITWQFTQVEDDR